MAGSQTFLTLGAIAIFMYMSVNIGRAYVNSSSRTIESQQKIEAVNYGLSLSDEMNSQVFSYDSLDTYYGDLNTLENPTKRKNYVSNLGDTLAATVELSSEQPLILGVNGRIATITVYLKKEGVFSEMSTHTVSILPFN